MSHWISVYWRHCTQPPSFLCKWEMLFRESCRLSSDWTFTLSVSFLETPHALLWKTWIVPNPVSLAGFHSPKAQLCCGPAVVILSRVLKLNLIILLVLFCRSTWDLNHWTGALLSRKKSMYPADFRLKKILNERFQEPPKQTNLVLLLFSLHYFYLWKYSSSTRRESNNNI